MRKGFSSEWIKLEIGELIDLLTGYPFSSSEYAETGVRLLRGSNIKRGKTDWNDDLTKYWSHVPVELKKYELATGDIVIAMDGSLVGQSFAQLTKSDLPALLLQRVARARAGNRLSQNYLKEWLCSKFFTEHCDSVKTVTAIPHISPEDIRSFKIMMPVEIEEQHAIAQALSDVDELIQGLEQLIAKKRDIKTATLQQLLTGKTRLPGFDGKWHKIEISEVIDLLTGYPFPSSEYAETGIRLLRGSNIKRGETDWNDNLTQYWSHVPTELKKYELEVGDIVIAMDGSLVGQSFAQLATSDLPALLLQRVARVRSGNGLSQNYLKEWLCSKFFTEHCDSVKTVTAIPHISPEDIRSFKIMMPVEIEEQHAIAQVLTDLDDEITTLESRLAKTRALKQGMMQDLLTGRVRLVGEAA